MQYKKNAFTMIELIFVIVILGILAAVAVPKLMATRDDAQISKMAMAISSSASDISGYAVSNGKIETDISKMSGIIDELIITNDAKQDDLTVPKVDFKAGEVAECISLQISSGNDANLSISFGNANGDRLCLSLQSMFNISDYPIPLKGNTIQH